MSVISSFHGASDISVDGEPSAELWRRLPGVRVVGEGARLSPADINT